MNLKCKISDASYQNHTTLIGFFKAQIFTSYKQDACGNQYNPYQMPERALTIGPIYLLVLVQLYHLH